MLMALFWPIFFFSEGLAPRQRKCLKTLYLVFQVSFSGTTRGKIEVHNVFSEVLAL